MYPADNFANDILCRTIPFDMARCERRQSSDNLSFCRVCFDLLEAIDYIAISLLEAFQSCVLVYVDEDEAKFKGRHNSS
jgi:hypothetical protein